MTCPTVLDSRLRGNDIVSILEQEVLLDAFRISANVDVKIGKIFDYFSAKADVKMG